MNKFITQALKYGVVGIMNTLLTAVTIWLILHFVFFVRKDADASALAISVSNVVGYIVGLINSFIWNRSWTFKSQQSWKGDFLRFVAAFLVCYIPQLLLVMLLNTLNIIPSLQFDLLGSHYVITSAYLCQLIGIVFYTALNFLCNKYYTFRKS